MSQSTFPGVDRPDQDSDSCEVLSESSETWLDELCLEPLLAPEPGFSQLCNACTLVWCVHPGDGSANHIQYLDTLIRSAQRGCVLCALILYRTEGDDPSHRPSRRLNMRYKVGFPFGDSTLLGVTLTSDKTYVELLMLPLGTDLDFFSWEHTLRSVLLGTHSRYLSTYHDVVPSTSSLENQVLARKLLHKCLSGHENCIAGARSLPNIPTRLIEINGSDAKPLLRLVETASRPREEEYMTLSHCWGTADFLTLRESCLDEMKKGVVWSSLPKTFRDAVTVTMWFKIKYLWIDSLCIIQDCHQDWERESQLMKHIYKNSFLTIAATKAVDARGGLFVDRNPDVVRIPRLRVRWSRGGRELAGDYLYFIQGLCWEEINQSPLMKRAWACQERLLSPRMLHFGQSQIFWECQDLDACETFSENLPPEIDSSPGSESKRRSESKRLLFFKGGDFYKDHWNGIIGQYSTGNLTKMSDKCIAFAGIVEEFQAFAQSTYLAGFWRHNFEQQLLWFSTTLLTTSRPQSYIAPSWSWLSVNGSHVFPHWFSKNEKVLLEILDVRVTHSTDNILGPIKSGYIHARGILGAVVWAQTDADLWDFREIRGRLRGVGFCRVFLDDIVEEISGDAVYLPIIEENSPLVIQGLLLVPTGEAKKEYRRIG